MLFWLLTRYSPLMEHWNFGATGDSRVYLTARTALAALTSFVAALVFGPLAIRWLKSHFRERIDSASAKLNELHAAKNATPTMGGLFIIGAIVVGALLCGDLSNLYLQLGIVTVIFYGGIGACDDWVKNKTRKRGLTARQKFVAQCLCAMVVLVPLYFHHKGIEHGLDFIFPLGRLILPLGPLFIVWGMFVMVGTSNGVNLTDGLDGLAAGCLLFAGSAFAVLCYLSGHRIMAEYLDMVPIVGAGELTILFGAMVGSVLGFLWYNCYPAQVFMGDTGSLPTGALLAFGGLVIRQEILLLIIGGIFAVETLSVILQVASFRLTGKRILRCSPLHNHYLFRGDPETRIVTRFWIMSAVLALLAVASLKIR